MIVESVRGAARRRLSAWARERGFEAPAVVLQPAPAHVAADACLPWPLAAAKLLRRKPLDVAQEAAALLKDLPGVAAA
ncbi:MAG: hypothetical protein KGL53_14995, partial [Elusimicrobia bacterium]|nr:hypothetical protein [Elusimicrobiota bacterium]